MRGSTIKNAGGLLLGLGVLAVGVHLACQGEQAADRHRMTAADIERWMTELSSWGRWGEGDELGAVNLITPAKRREAAQLVREGVSVSLARDAEMTGAIDNPYPFAQEMKMTPPFASDVFSVRYHGFAHTHIDSLCHLEALGNEAEKQGRWEFLLTAAPLPVPGGTGSPLNPIATF